MSNRCGVLTEPISKISEVRGIGGCPDAVVEVSPMEFYVNLAERNGRGMARTEDSGSKATRPPDSIGDRTCREAHESGAGFSAVFRTIPVGWAICRRPGPPAAPARVARDTPEFSDCRLEDESQQ
jgi:hypothetical protein